MAMEQETLVPQEHVEINLFTSDIDLSNEAKGGNEIDGTWGSYTIQEGENDLFLINRRNGKRYKFVLQEVS